MSVDGEVQPHRAGYRLTAAEECGLCCATGYSKVVEFSPTGSIQATAAAMHIATVPLTAGRFKLTASGLAACGTPTLPERGCGERTLLEQPLGKGWAGPVDLHCDGLISEGAHIIRRECRGCRGVVLGVLVAVPCVTLD